MSNSDSTPTTYKPNVKRDFGISPLWILPIVTLALASWLVINAINDAGQRIQIYFSDAQGLIAGRTTIQYQGLEVGMVRDISLSSKLDNIYVDADIYPQATKLLGENTRFWLVKPTASISGISGLDALVSGNYIAIQPGEELNKDDDQEFPKKYTALNERPADFQAAQGLNITLRSQDLGSISIGSQIVYKKIPIGEVYSYKLDDEAKNVLIKAYIKNEFANLVTNKSRFWNVSGAGAQIGFHGVDVQFESLSALLTGAIAVDSPDGGEPVNEKSQFKLYPDLKTAGRGIPIKITLPDENKIGAGGAPIMYQGLEIGQITDLSLSEGRSSIIASAAIQPAFSDTLNGGTRFLLEEAKVSLAGVENLSNLVTGNYLTLIPGEGESTRNFTAVRKDDLLKEKQHSIAISLTADNSFGLDPGTAILYRGFAVGSIIETKLVNDQVIFNALIDSQYRDLIRSKNRFFVTGSATAELTESGLNVTVPPAKQLLTGSISFVSEGSDTVNSDYRLFANQSLAELASYNQSGTLKLTLFANELPSISKGSPLLYRNLQVGKVNDYSLTDGGVKIAIEIENRYKHLLTKSTVFWNRSGVEVDASLSGVTIKASPLITLLKGGIAFDNLVGVENKLGKYWHLYDDFTHARRFGKTVSLITSDKVTVSKGSKIKFQGVTVGEVELLSPDFDKKQTEIRTRIYPEYAEKIALKGSYFWLVSPEFGINGVENLDSLVSAYIAVLPGKGSKSTQFTLHSTSAETTGITFTLQSEHRNSVSIGTPILYRDMDVGKVTSIELGTFADRVVSTIEIDPEYAYLVRENSVFWNVSGVDISIGLSGAQIKAGTFDSLLKGGIAFATPDSSTILSAAKPEHSFILHSESQPEWREWRTAIPKPEK
ncbi:MlaD family protein [Vibrio algarum]|uniref:MlaD family protein n=1 Tax=Vibrio algarum TaxID=3020714 RepID=A0ABT4YRA2_9VIBR|nr:MlaD family protein [Vibrio sp. KJ40-1]MDB1123915.1 MlaD family protein [Vibrio sp. KJ40-1]